MVRVEADVTNEVDARGESICCWAHRYFGGGVPLLQQVTRPLCLKQEDTTKIVCCYCGKDLGEKYPLQPGVSHGVCSTCFARVMAELDARREARTGGKA